MSYANVLRFRNGNAAGRTPPNSDIIKTPLSIVFKSGVLFYCKFVSGMIAEFHLVIVDTEAETHKTSHDVTHLRDSVIRT